MVETEPPSCPRWGEGARLHFPTCSGYFYGHIYFYPCRPRAAAGRRLLGFQKAQAPMVGSAVAIRLPLPLEPLGPTSRILLSCPREAEGWSVVGSASSVILQPPTGDGEHWALQEGRTYLLATTEFMLLACPESQSARGGADIRDSLGSTPPAEPASLNPRSLRRGSCLSNTHQASFSAPHARQPSRLPLCWDHTSGLSCDFPPDKFTEQ